MSIEKEKSRMTLPNMTHFYRGKVREGNKKIFRRIIINILKLFVYLHILLKTRSLTYLFS